MTVTEAIQARHSVRRYKDTPLPEDVIATIQQKISEVNAEGGLHIQLVTNETKGFKGILCYGTFSGVSNHFVVAGQKADDLDERAGYFGEQLVLLAQQLGLNTCETRLTYQKVAGTYTLNGGEKIVCHIALGYGETQGTERKHKPIREISNASDLTPKWFNRGVEAAQLAPTAVIQQKFFIEYVGIKEGNRHKLRIERTFSMVGDTQLDMSIVKLHFEIGAGKENFEWM